MGRVRGIAMREEEDDVSGLSLTGMKVELVEREVSAGDWLLNDCFIFLDIK